MDIDDDDDGDEEDVGSYDDGYIGEESFQEGIAESEEDIADENEPDVEAGGSELGDEAGDDESGEEAEHQPESKKRRARVSIKVADNDRDVIFQQMVNGKMCFVISVEDVADINGESVVS